MKKIIRENIRDTENHLYVSQIHMEGSPEESISEEIRNFPKPEKSGDSLIGRSNLKIYCVKFKDTVRS